MKVLTDLMLLNHKMIFMSENHKIRSGNNNGEPLPAALFLLLTQNSLHQESIFPVLFNKSIFSRMLIVFSLLCFIAHVEVIFTSACLCKELCNHVLKSAQYI